jgi:hypothetical protein
MYIFLEKFILPILAACVVTIILVNPMKFDKRQRVSLLIVVLALAYFTAHTVSMRKAAETQTPAPTTVTHTTGSATTSGAQSPAITGPGNTVTYGTPSPQKETPKKSK